MLPSSDLFMVDCFPLSNIDVENNQLQNSNSNLKIPKSKFQTIVQNSRKLMKTKLLIAKVNETEQNYTIFLFVISYYHDILLKNVRYCTRP
jgi:hypothetical protein